MADVRALLKAKRQEARISHPYAAYNPSGQLKCLVCGLVIKHASAWEGHLGSKSHRTNVARMREEENRQRIAVHEDEDDSETTGKRKAPAAEVESSQVEKKRKVEETPLQSQSFPQDFFSDPSRAPIPLSEGESDEEVEDGAPTFPTQHLPPSTEVDLEYQRFQLELLKNADPSETYDRATVVAEPVLASTDIPGFPTNADEAASTQPVDLTEEQTRRKREQEDRELIMDRLLEEERAQEDADIRVQLLKTKLEALRKKRASKTTI
jgi:zinc finger protein 830